MRSKYSISGMSCAACSGAVERSVKKLPGVTLVEVSLLTNSAIVEGEVSADLVISAIERAGFRASVFDATTLVSVNERKFTRFLVSLVFLVPLIVIAMGPMFGLSLPKVTDNTHFFWSLMQLLLTTPIILINFHYFTNGFGALVRRNPNMDSLVAIGSGVSFLYSIYLTFSLLSPSQSAHHLYFESAAMILTLVGLGKSLEEKSRHKTTEAISKLINLTPQTATIIEDGDERTIKVIHLRVGDTILVRPGDIIPVDGIIDSGTILVDQSSLTGESLPQDKREGDLIHAGTVVVNGSCRFQAREVGPNTLIAKIIDLVTSTCASKPPIARMADLISRWFVPAVILISLITFLIWLPLEGIDQALACSLSVLVISCPCALGLATPVAIITASGQGARHGILFRSAQVLELCNKVTTAFFDKTGTLTKGQFAIVKVWGDVGLVATSLESLTNHPLGAPIVEYFNDLTPLKVTDFSLVPGEGLRGLIDGKVALIGNPRMMKNNGVAVADNSEMEEVLGQGATLLHVAYDGRHLGAIALADQLHEDAVATVGEYHRLGIKTVLLTGDNHLSAMAIGERLQIDQVIYEVYPDQKESYIRKAQEEGQVVAMIGDGINDAPALTRADIGMAIGAGSDIALEAADLILVNSSPRDSLMAIKLGRRTIRIIKENLFWAFIYNVVGIPIAAGLFYNWLGWKMDPMWAAAAMSCSSISVVLNALRIRRFRIKEKV